MMNEAIQVDCAVARAGNEIMLCLDAREGRNPIKSVLIGESHLGWICSDGKVETPYLTGSSGTFDLLDLVAAARSNGILISEMNPADTAKPVVNWLMSAPKSLSGWMDGRKRTSN